MMDGKAYIESLGKLNTKVYVLGEEVESLVDHPFLLPHINAAALTYELACQPEYEALMTTMSHLTGQKINRFTSVHRSTDDLAKKVKMIRMLGQKTGSCFQRCVGYDALNATYSVTYEMDKKNGTDYHERFKKYLQYIQETDHMVCGAMTDAKGDRSKGPSEQSDPDLYLRIVEQNDRGIVITGCKQHMTGVVNSHEMLLMPTRAMGPNDKDYAVVCAVPVDAPGLFHIFGRQTNDERKLSGCEMDVGNAAYGIVGGEAASVFENVFVPWERVFMCGEVEFSGMLVERFATYHRQNYGACKGGVSDVVIGASVAMAEYNGALGASHIKDKLVEMTLLVETLFAGSLACSHEGYPTESGAYYADPLLANITKQNATRMIYEIDRLAHDIAGGLIATLPSQKDLEHPVIGKYVEKYFKGSDTATTEERFRMTRLLENMTGGTALAEAMHGAGPPAAQRVALARQGNFSYKKKLAEKLAGIKRDEKK